MTAQSGFVWFLPVYVSMKINDTLTLTNSTSTKNGMCTDLDIRNAMQGHFAFSYSSFAEDSVMLDEGISVREWHEKYKEVRGDSDYSLYDDYGGFSYDALWVYVKAVKALISGEKLKISSQKVSNVHSQISSRIGCKRSSVPLHESPRKRPDDEEALGNHQQHDISRCLGKDSVQKWIALHRRQHLTMARKHLQTRRHVSAENCKWIECWQFNFKRHEHQVAEQRSTKRRLRDLHIASSCKCNRARLLCDDHDVNYSLVLCNLPRVLIIGAVGLETKIRETTRRSCKHLEQLSQGS